MSVETQAPAALLARAAALFARGRVRLRRSSVGTVVRGQPEDFIVFRQVVLMPDRHKPRKPGALYRVRFRFARFPQAANRVLSLIPIPLIIAQPGFRSKTWMSGLTSGAFQGAYEWDTIEDARRYRDSLPLRLMRGRALPGSLEEEIREV